jgi:hypothetical protein
VSTRLQPLEEFDDDLQVRVVQPSELGAKLARPAGEVAAAAEEPPHSAAAQLRPAAAATRTALQPPAARVDPPPLEARPGSAAAPATSPAAPAAPGAGAVPPADGQARGRGSDQARRPKVAPATHAAAPAVAATAPRRLISGSSVFIVATCALLVGGWCTQTERYISPKRGIGYALGIIGGSLMLILLLYSLRKRWSWLRFLGPTPSWFRFHMVLGILGPLCILYHSNFSTGATNSNVALFCMLTVAGSGLVGRYIYAHIHHGLYGRKLHLGELRTQAESLHGGSGAISFLPELARRLDEAERRLLRTGPRLSLLGFTKPPIVALAGMFARWRLHGYIRRALRKSARKNPVIAAERKRLRATARAYVARRIAATRRVAAFEGYERLFSLWHALHIPLIFMMIIAAIIHVIAVHVY